MSPRYSSPGHLLPLLLAILYLAFGVATAASGCHCQGQVGQEEAHCLSHPRGAATSGDCCADHCCHALGHQLCLLGDGGADEGLTLPRPVPLYAFVRSDCVLTPPHRPPIPS